jgi:hypothetical protein
MQVNPHPLRLLHTTNKQSPLLLFLFSYKKHYHIQSPQSQTPLWDPETTLHEKEEQKNLTAKLSAANHRALRQSFSSARQSFTLYHSHWRSPPASLTSRDAVEQSGGWEKNGLGFWGRHSRTWRFDAVVPNEKPSYDRSFSDLVIRRTLVCRRLWKQS